MHEQPPKKPILNRVKAVETYKYLETYLEKCKKIEDIIKNEKPFCKPIYISKDDMDKFEKEVLKKKAKL